MMFRELFLWRRKDLRSRMYVICWKGKSRNGSIKHGDWIERSDTDRVCCPRRCMGFLMLEIANLISSNPKR